MATQKTYKQQDLLGPNSYPAIVEQIVEKIRAAQAQTLSGEKLLQEVYKNLNESITPMMDIKPFITKAEQISGDDATLAEIVAFCKKAVTTGDLNFIINLAKEEHYANMSRLNHPSPESTIKNIEDYGEPSSVIEKGIKAGLFNDLDSKLLNKIKIDLGVIDQKDKKLNESVEPLINGNLIKYSPIGIRFEDTKTNSIVLLLENDILSYDRELRNYSSLTKEITKDLISNSHRALMEAINSCSYNPETEEFSLNENWDFDLKLDNVGQPMVKAKNNTVSLNESEFVTIPKEKVKTLFIESIKEYKLNPTQVGNLNIDNLMENADQFIVVMENYDRIIKFDNLETIRNLNENTYILVDKEGAYSANCPQIIGSSIGFKEFESYTSMMESCHEILKTNISDLYESQLKNENELMGQRNSRIVSLNEEQKELNVNILKLRDLKTIAEDNSPAMDKLLKQEKQFDVMLNENISNLNFYKNEFKLY